MVIVTELDLRPLRGLRAIGTLLTYSDKAKYDLLTCRSLSLLTACQGSLWKLGTAAFQTNGPSWKGRAYEISVRKLINQGQDCSHVAHYSPLNSANELQQSLPWGLPFALSCGVQEAQGANAESSVEVTTQREVMSQLLLVLCIIEQEPSNFSLEQNITHPHYMLLGFTALR